MLWLARLCKRMSDLPSDVSWDNLPSSSDDEKRPARTADIAEVPVVSGPYLPKPGPVDLSRFWHAHPLDTLEGLEEPQLVERFGWSNKVKEELKRQLVETTDEFRAEWLAKERLLDQVLRKSLGEEASILELDNIVNHGR